MNKNPEDKVIADIDALITRQVRRGERDGREEHCKLCGQDWHGLDNGWCPGPFATPKQKKKFKQRPRYRKVTTHWSVPERRVEQARALREHAPNLDEFVPLTEADAQLSSFLALINCDAYLLEAHTPEAADILARAPHQLVFLGDVSVRRLIDPATVIRRLSALSRDLPPIQPIDEAETVRVTLADFPPPQYTIYRANP